MAAPSTGLIKTVRVIDKFTDTTGTWIAWLNVPLVAVVAWEVIARYAFNAPTIWSFDLTYMLYGTIFMLGTAYALYKGAHIRTDFFFEKWSIRTKGWIDSVAYIVFFFPSIFTFLIVSGGEGWYAVAPDPVAVQDGGAARLPAAADPGRVRGDQECVGCAHRHRARP
jgi:TRAP-type mannitol/chloroaromatic compound transport system permease small subunit